jgi:hypothetical protein
MEDIKTKHQVHVPKRVREYMFELLSTFIAVALAFLSQYYFQYRSDRSTEHDLMVSLVADLKTDVSSADRLNKEIKELEDYYHSLEFSIINYNGSLELEKKIYYDSLKVSTTNYQIQFAESTLNQLKNAGGLRLVKDPEIVNAITLYDNNNRFLINYLNNISTRKEELLVISSEILITYIFFQQSYTDFKTYNPLALDKIYQKYGSSLASNDRNKLLKYGNAVNDFYSGCYGFSNRCVKHSKDALQLITLIQSRYHIE